MFFTLKVLPYRFSGINSFFSCTLTVCCEGRDVRISERTDLGLIVYFCRSWAGFESAYYIHNTTITIVKRLVISFRTSVGKFLLSWKLKVFRSNTASDSTWRIGFIGVAWLMIKRLHFGDWSVIKLFVCIFRSVLRYGAMIGRTERWRWLIARFKERCGNMFVYFICFTIHSLYVIGKQWKTPPSE